MTRGKGDRDVKPLVSVVIPCYGQASFLPDAIQSVLHQSYSSTEIIVVDDGSPDDVAAVVRRYPEARYKRQENRGSAVARNVGIRLASGLFVVLLDADDRLLPQALSTGVRALLSHPECAFVWGRCEFIDREGKGCEWVEPDGTRYFQEPPYRGEDHYFELLRACVVSTGSAVWRTDIFRQVGFFDEAFWPADDWDMYLRVARSFPIYCHNELVLQYRRHGANATEDAARMLEVSLALLQAQSPFVESTPAHSEAWLYGMETARRYYGELLAQHASDLLRSGDEDESSRALEALWRFYPVGAKRVQAGLVERRGHRRAFRELLTRSRSVISARGHRRA